jgi:signal transduction histidine kinase
MQADLARAHEPEGHDLLEQELADFSYIVSHDLSTSFRHVSTFARLLLADLGETLTRSQAFYAEQIRAAADRCQAQMEQLLIYSRVQQKELTRRPIDATRVMETALLQLSAETKEARADVAIEPLGEVSADPDLLLIAFKHLLSNALKFRRPGAPARVSVRAAPFAGAWGMQIRDNGVGLAAPYREKAFRMFFQLHPDGPHPGVGAGLAITRRIARRHGGDVQFVDSESGACVQMLLPKP